MADDLRAMDLPAPDAWTDSVGDRNEDARTPCWDLESGLQLDEVSAYVEGVAIDGCLLEGPYVAVIERDALRLLAAVAEHRRMFDEAQKTRREVTR